MAHIVGLIQFLSPFTIGLSFVFQSFVGAYLDIFNYDVFKF